MIAQTKRAEQTTPNEIKQPEILNPEIVNGSEAVVDSVNQHSNVMNVVLDTINSDLTRLSGVDKQSEIAGKRLNELKQEAVAIEEGFWGQIAKIIRLPAEKARAFFEARQESALAIADNPNIIAEITKEINRAFELRRKLEKKLIKAGVESGQAYSQTRSDLEFNQILEDAHSLFVRANKKDSKKWEDIQNNIDSGFTSQLSRTVSEGRLLDLSKIWLKLSDKRQEEIVERIAKEIFYYGGKKLQENENFLRPSLANFVERKQQYDSWFENTVEVVSVPYLQAALHENYQRQASSLFPYNEVVLLENSDKVNLSLGLLSKKTQDRVLYGMTNNKQNDFWVKILSHPEGVAIAEAFSRNEIIERSISVEKIFEMMSRYSLDQIVSAFDRVSPKYPDYVTLTEPEFEGIISIAIHDVDPDIIVKLDRIKLESIGALSRVYNSDQMRDLCAPEALEDYSEISAQHLHVSKGDKNIFENKLSPAVANYFTKIPNSTEHYIVGNRNGKQINQNEGIQSRVQIYIRLQRTLARIPERFHEEIFQLVGHGNDESCYSEDLVSEEFIENFLRYHRDLVQGSTFILDDLFKNKDVFVGERWQDIQRGIDILKNQAVFETVRDKKYALTLFELVGKTKDEKANDIIFKFLSSHDEVVGLSYSNNNDVTYKKEERTNRDIEAFYKFANSCEQIFKIDTKEMVEFYKLDEADFRIISTFLSGNIDKQDFVDLPIIEGKMIYIGHIIDAYDTDKKVFEKIVLLDTKQKQTLLKLRQMYGNLSIDELVEYSQNNKGAKIVESNNRLKCNPAIDQAAELSEIDNLGIVYYFQISFNNHLDRGLFDNIIKKCKELQDLGLDSSYYLSEPADRELSIDMYDDFLNKFLEMPSDFIVKASEVLKKYGFHQKLRSFVYLDVEDLNNFEMRVRSKRISGETDTCVSRYTSVIPQESLANAEVRFDEIQKACPSLKLSGIAFKYMNIEQDQWQELLAKPDILYLFMQSRWNEFPGFKVSSENLNNPFFWQESIPSEIYLNDELLNTHLSFLQNMQARHLAFTSPTDQAGCINLYNTFEQIKSVFPEEILNNCSLDLLSRYVKKNTEQLIEFASLFVHDTNWYEVQDIMKKISDWPSEKKLLIKNIRSLVGSSLPVNSFKKLEELMEQHHDAETILGQMDDKNSHNSSYYFEWSRFRMDAQLTNFTKEKYPIAYEMYGREMMPFLGELANCNELDFQHLDQLAQMGKKLLEGYGLRCFSEQLLVVAKHPNFEMIFNFLQSTETNSRSSFYLSTEEVKEFCDSIKPDTLDSFLKLSEFGNIELNDLMKFLRYPSDVDKFVEFAKKMYSIFDKKISIRDYFLMDIERVNSTLKYLQTHTLVGLSEKNLQRILVISNGQMESDIKLVLASFDSRQDISTEESIDKLLSVPVEFRWSILKEKSSNFGWELLNKKDQLYQLGLSEEQLEELWVTLYKESGLPTNISLDVRTARILLKKQNTYYHENNNDIVCHILRSRIDPLPEYYDILREEKEAVGYFMSHLNVDLDLWKDDVCLSLFLQTNFERFTAQLSHINPEFIISHGTEIIEKIKENDPKISLYFYIQCQEAKIGFSPENQASLLEEIIKQTLVSSAENCHYLLDQSAKGSIFLLTEQKSELADRYLSQGGYLPDQSPYDEDAKKEVTNLILERAQTLVEQWKENKDVAISILSKFLKQKKFTNEHLDILHTIMQETDISADIAKNKVIFNVFVEYLTYIDPTIKDTLNNPNKLGKLKDIVMGKIIEYIQSINVDGSLSHEEIHLAVHKKLQEISRVFSSSNTKESDKRLIFMDMYNLKSCNDPTVADLSAEEIMNRLRQDVEDVVLLSGSEFQILSMRRELDLTDDPEKKEDLQKKLDIARLAVEQAEIRNRQITDFLPPGAFTHGMPSSFLELVLKNGNLSGELLGSSTKTDASGLLGVDLSKVIGDNASEKSFAERYKALGNHSYGDVVLVYGQYKNQNRPPYFSGAIGEDHYLVRGGIPTTEITTIILRQNDKELIEKVKKDIATKGNYIPMVDKEGVLLFSQEEFDNMQVFYCSLNKKGYPRAVIDNVCAYVVSEKGEKHQAVMDAVQAHLFANKGDDAVDLAVLVDFLRSNDLNERPIEWYKTQPFNKLYDFIKKTVGRKKRAKARETIFGKEFSDAFNQRVVQGKEITIKPEHQHNAFVDAFLEKQLPFVYGDDENGELQKKIFEGDLTNMLFREKSPTATLEIAQRFSEFKKEFMRTLWNKAWEKIGESDMPEDSVLDYKKYIVPAVVGSVGRGEVVLGSDLDYLLYVDDVAEPISEEQLDSLKKFINTKLGPIMNNLLEEQGIHADAGLAKADRVPFTLLSTIRDFKVDLTKPRQVEEPTNMLDSDALFVEQAGTVTRAKEMMLVENTTAHYLDSYIAKDLEIGTDRHPGYQTQFETLYASVASGDLMTRVKESLQRAVVFKLYYLLFEGFNSGKIPKDLAGSVPASVDGKIKLLSEYKILTQKEAVTCSELVAFAYKIRFLGEIYSDEAKQQKTLADKVANVKFRLDDISYDERLKLVGLLKEFKSTVLYK